MLLWMDGFDHYGDAVAPMLNGSWSALDNASGSTGSITLNTEIVRTGVHSLKIGPSSGTNPGARSKARRTFTEPLVTVGLAFAVYFPALPSSSITNGILFSDTGNLTQCSLWFGSDGTLVLRRGAETAPIIATSSQAITAEAWNHVEIRLTIGDLDGAIEIRVNGATVLSAAGVDTKAQATLEVSQFTVGYTSSNTLGGPVGVIMHLDDMFTWDTSGAFNNDFVGDQRVFTQIPIADGLEQQWLPSIGADRYAMIDEAPPSEDDYISTATAGDRSAFVMSALPATVFSIAGVQAVPYARKTDAGAGSMVANFKTATAETAIDSRPMTTAGTYWTFISEANPDTDAPWSPASFFNAEMVLERTL